MADERKMIADGFWYADKDTGEKRWMIGDMLLATVRGKIGRKALEAVLEAIGERVGTEVRERRDEAAALRAEIAERIDAAIVEQRKTLQATADRIEVQWKEKLLGLEREKLELEALKRGLPSSRTRIKAVP
jgi:hypothetical protein